MVRGYGKFVWDAKKERANVQKHGIDFLQASQVFLDPKRKVYTDSKHSKREPRFFCIGRVGRRILTVRFVYRSGKVRIFGAGYWRKGRRHYEKKN